MIRACIDKALDTFLTSVWPPRSPWSAAAPAAAMTTHLLKQHRDRTWVGRDGWVWMPDPLTDYWIGTKPGHPILYLSPRFDTSPYGPFTHLPHHTDVAAPLPAAADPAGSSPSPAGSPVAPEGVESSRSTIPPSGHVPPAVYGRMECEGPDTNRPAECGAEFDVISDAELLRTAAHIIAGWRPLLLRGAGEVYDVDELDDFVKILRDRAVQFDAIQFTDPSTL